MIGTGHKVTKEYYVNDKGSQIAILGNSLFKRYQQIRGKKVIFVNGEYSGDYLIELSKKISEKDNDKWLNVNEDIRKKYFENYGVNELLKLIKNDLKDIDISFDKFSYESKIIEQNKLKIIINLLKKKNLLYTGTLEKPKGDDSTNWKPRKQLLESWMKF